MGYDLSGLDPVLRVEKEGAYETYHKYANMDWNERQDIFKKDKELEDKFWEEYNARDNENPGIYFRANVWWWRRIWQFTCLTCDDILNEDDIAGGGSNSYHEITADKASLIAKKLQEEIDNGGAKEFEDVIAEYIADAETDENGNPKDWDANYPFKVSFLQEFVTFCSESGGFTIG